MYEYIHMANENRIPFGIINIINEQEFASQWTKNIFMAHFYTTQLPSRPLYCPPPSLFNNWKLDYDYANLLIAIKEQLVVSSRRTTDKHKRDFSRGTELLQNFPSFLIGKDRQILLLWKVLTNQSFTSEGPSMIQVHHILPSYLRKLTTRSQLRFPGAIVREKHELPNLRESHSIFIIIIIPATIKYPSTARNNNHSNISHFTVHRTWAQLQSVVLKNVPFVDPIK